MFKWKKNKGNWNSGDWNSGDWNPGDWNSGDSNSGDWNSGDWNPGDWNSGNSNSGDWNSGNRNSGDRNSGNRNSGYGNSGYGNSGDFNSGNRNSGNRNSGNRNSGNRNSGYGNSGDFNSGYCNSGYGNSGIFNSNQPTLRLFNKDSNLNYNDKIIQQALDIISNVKPILTWVDSDSMTTQEKEEHPEHKTTGGFLRSRDMEYCWKKSWEKMSDEDKETITSLPNFNAKIFKEITGVDVTNNLDPEDEIEVER